MQETWVRSLGWEDSPEEEKGYPLQYSGLENSMDCIVHGGYKKLDTTEQLSLSLSEVAFIPWLIAPSSIFKARNCITLACLHQQLSSPLTLTPPASLLYVFSCSDMSTLCDPLDCPRLLCPWDSPGKNTGVCCHFLLQGIF